MTAYPDPALDDVLTSQLADLITEAVVWSGDPEDRARALVQIVSCALDALRWRLQPAGSPHEELSADQILQAANEHLVRMRREGDPVVG